MIQWCRDWTFRLRVLRMHWEQDCDGWDCACGGLTVREAWEQHL